MTKVFERKKKKSQESEMLPMSLNLKTLGQNKKLVEKHKKKIVENLQI